jgi:hypothetical protein
VRRRVLHGLRNEGQMAKAITAHNLPDSEPADVVWAISPEGELLEQAEDVKAFLARREAAVKLLADLGQHGDEARFHGRHAHEAIARAREIVAAPLVFFECKTLITQQGPGAIHMSRKARQRKEEWSRRYGAEFWTVAFDDRRGHKHSGHRLYARRGVGSARLAAMDRAADFGELMAKIEG